MEFHCFIVLDVLLYIPRLVSVFQDVSVIHEHENFLHSQMFARGITFLDCSLHASIVGVTASHLGSPNYILVSSLSHLYLCPVTL